MDSPGKNTGVGSHSLLQGIFLGSKPRSPALQADSLPSEPPGKSDILTSRKEKHDIPGKILPHPSSPGESSLRSGIRALLTFINHPPARPPSPSKVHLALSLHPSQPSFALKTLRRNRNFKTEVLLCCVYLGSDQILRHSTVLTVPYARKSSDNRIYLPYLGKSQRSRERGGGFILLCKLVCLSSHKPVRSRESRGWIPIS